MENQFSHTFTEAIATVVPERELVQKGGKWKTKKKKDLESKKSLHH